MGAADPIFKTPTQAPAAPVASPAPLAPYDPDPYYGTNTKTPAATPAPVATPAPAVAPTAPQQPYVNPFMQTYGQNRTPQQQMFNRFPQSFQQPQPQSVAQPAQGPVYADQSLNAPGNQPQQYSGQPQYGRFGRGFMPQNRGGYERQMDQLRGGYNRPMPPMMQNNPQPDAAYNTYMQSLPEYAQQQDLQKQMAALSAKMEADPQGTTMRNALQANARQIMPQQDMGYGGGYGRFNMDRGQQQSPPNAIQELSRDEIMRQYDAAKANQVNNPSGQQQGMQQAAFMNSLLKGQPLSGQPATGQTPIPAYAQPYATSLANQPNTPAGGKGGNPTAGGLGNGGNPAPINGLYDPGYR